MAQYKEHVNGTLGYSDCVFRTYKQFKYSIFFSVAHLQLKRQINININKVC